MNILDPLFWKFDGEVVFCKKCNKAKVIEYESSLSSKLGYMVGSAIVKLLEISIVRMIQRNIKNRIIVLHDEASKSELSENNPPQNRNKSGNYLKRYGVCNECLKKGKVKTVFDEKHLLSKYLDMVNEFKNKKQHIEWETYMDINENPTPELLADINPQAFEKLKNSKHFGMKKEKRRLAERYINESVNDIVALVQKRVNKDEELQKLKSEIVEVEEHVKEFLEGCGEVIKGYTVIGRHIGFIPNPDKHKKLLEMFPDKIFSNEKFYDVKNFYKKEIQGILDDAEKLSCNKKILFNYDLVNRLSVKISKMDFWSK